MVKVKMLILVLCLFALSSASVFAEESNRIEKEKKVVQSYGISSEFAKDLTDQDLERFLAQEPRIKLNRDEYFKFVHTVNKNPQMKTQMRDSEDNISTTVTKVSKEEALEEIANEIQNEISTLSVGDAKTTTTSWLRLETNMTYYNNNGQVSVRFQWLKNANYKREDILAIGLSNNVAPLNNTASFVHKTDTYNPLNMDWREYSENNATLRYHPGGVTAQFNLFSPAMNYKDERGYLSFTVKPREGGKWNLNSFYDTLGYYRHQEKVFSVSPSVSIPIGGSLSLSQQDKFSEVDSFAQIQYK
ncbi:hypothetical protein PAECIP112173_00278 [Paenibacillus sp. JJ-100]|uniref:hypothetical protein n=1 Tax=Paenibacillus sp. JJ-100 TaxID=2974896 RepID=UPI0022FF5D57|nr:hypothetical protein [Paenibacillus sp. JJ-100]CAI6021770.1 hypothetical protein PAECIP112173_00278 [Paenibacillus sp. JJ-100]